MTRTPRASARGLHRWTAVFSLNIADVKQVWKIASVDAYSLWRNEKMRNLHKETEAAILAWIRSQSENRRKNWKSPGCRSYKGWKVMG